MAADTSSHVQPRTPAPRISDRTSLRLAAACSCTDSAASRDVSIGPNATRSVSIRGRSAICPTRSCRPSKASASCPAHPFSFGLAQRRIARPRQCLDTKNPRNAARITAADHSAG